MEPDEELRIRIQRLERDLAQAKWQSDMDRQIAEQKEYVRKENQKENSYFLWFLAIFVVLPFIYYAMKY